MMCRLTGTFYLYLTVFHYYRVTWYA